MAAAAAAPVGMSQWHDLDECIVVTGRRYSFRNQPQMVYWNLIQLATAFLRAELLKQVLAFLSTAASWALACTLHLQTMLQRP